MKIVIVGGGFGGLACARKLGGSEHEVVVIDKSNHNLFQPLLYQVATGALSPADIAEPIRKLLKRHQNIRVVLGELIGVDTAGSKVNLVGGNSETYDVLVLATGSRYIYFGHDEWAQYAPGLKTIDNARTIRGRLLRSFEAAEISNDPAEQERLMTTVVIGGGPTGVEMAGAIAELGRWTLRSEFRRIDPAQSRVVLVEGSPSILGQFPENLRRYAADQLKGLGVTVLTNTRVEEVRPNGVQIGGEFLPAGTVVWGAGVGPTPAAEWLATSPAQGGRIAVDDHLAVKDLQNVYALGDIAYFVQDGRPLPGLAQVAKQQGEYLGEALRKPASAAETPGFRFRNRGNTAVIGRHAAIFDFGRFQMKGGIAWLLWAIVHVYLLVSFEKRTLVSLQWLWRYISRARGVRLIP
jgi:NADH dehydrogenase